VIDVQPREWVVKLCTRSNILADDLQWERAYLAAVEGPDGRKTGDK